jgi:hypothetical protein
LHGVKYIDVNIIDEIYFRGIQAFLWPEALKGRTTSGW